jgi:hypothetical protein
MSCGRDIFNGFYHFAEKPVPRLPRKGKMHPLNVIG